MKKEQPHEDEERSLRSRFLSHENFQLAWDEVAANHGCAGVDGETIEHFSQHKDHYIRDLIAALLADLYHPMPLRQLFIPKKQSGWRELRVPTVRDRLVQQALLNLLHPILEPQFEQCSFAYRPGRSHLAAVRQVSHWRDRGYEWVVDGDIVKFFDQVQHDRLIAEVAERLNDSFVLGLIRQWLSVGVLTQAGIVFPEKGIAQGAVVSPIFANVYLDDLDEQLSAMDVKLVRFSDDFVILTRTQTRSEQARDQVAVLLAGMGLELHPEKTQITNFKRGFRFLGHAFAGNVVVTVGKEKVAEPEQKREVELILRHCDPVAQPTVMQQALVEALKTSGKPIPPPLFVVLGYAVRDEVAGSIDSRESAWRSEMSTLYLVQQGTTLRKEQGRLVVQQPQEADLEIPIREVERVLVFGNIQLTTQVISTCLEAGISIVFLTQLGEYKGHLWSAGSNHLEIETAQFEFRRDPEFQMAIAREIVKGKLWNSKQLLRFNRKRSVLEVTEAISMIANAISTVSDLTKVTTIDPLMGYEGSSAARYFPALGRLITNPGFTLTERTRRPPKDPVNSLLSFGYTLLYDNVLSLLLAEGMNPYLGNLHYSEAAKQSLAFDLMEEFRASVVDALV
ncbi:MAG: CRISPR-associated endonuclease Cas1, partial [Phormidesmis sp. CAN_BIN44]|nr:CRISPR-associated endonuclease Cas1 [Phormidesmis sp. CAN_BIN44]